jgi:hypothetical protein
MRGFDPEHPAAVLGDVRDEIEQHSSAGNGMLDLEVLLICRELGDHIAAARVWQRAQVRIEGIMVGDEVPCLFRLGERLESLTGGTFQIEPQNVLVRDPPIAQPARLKIRPEVRAAREVTMSCREHALDQRAEQRLAVICGVEHVVDRRLQLWRVLTAIHDA